MPKKSATARNAAQRYKTKSQKSFELVRPEGAERENPDYPEQPAASPVSSTAIATPERSTLLKTEAESAETTSEAEEVAPKGSAAARMAARRRTMQKAAQQRSSAALITADHFSYVRRDLITIGILAAVMVVAIVVLYLTLGRA